MSKKNKRIATNSNYELHSKEWIEIDDDGYMYWKCIDYISALSFGGVKCIQSSFPVDIDTVSDFFERIGRKLDLSMLPPNAVMYPYGSDK